MSAAAGGLVGLLAGKEVGDQGGELVAINRARGRGDFEYELLDTGVFDEDRYFDVFVEYAKAAPEDLLVEMTVHNRGPEQASLHVLPTLWFRHTWVVGRRQRCTQPAAGPRWDGVGGGPGRA